MIFKNNLICLILVGYLSFTHALAEDSKQIQVVTTTPDLEWLVKKVGGQLVDVSSLLDGSEDPHFVDAMPHFVSKVAKADVFCFVGLELEVAWAPKILRKSGNAAVQKGGKGHCDAGSGVKAIEIPTGKIDRSMGDVHSSGNPHYHLSPTSFFQAAQIVADSLTATSPDHASTFQKNLASLETELKEIKNRVSARLTSKQKLRIMQYHKEFSYFITEFKLNSEGSIEQVPGVPPSAGRLARVAAGSKDKKIDLVLASENSPKKILEKFTAMTKVPHISVPIGIRKDNDPKDYEALLLGLAEKISASVNNNKNN